MQSYDDSPTCQINLRCDELVTMQFTKGKANRREESKLMKTLKGRNKLTMGEAHRYETIVN